MFKWLFRVGLGFLVARLVATYKSPEAKEKPFPDKPAPKPRKKKA